MKLLEHATKNIGFKLNSGQIGQFEAYFTELVDWNNRVNLTAITDYEEVQTKHFLDSLTLAGIITAFAPAGDCSIIDIGTGAGLPGIPLKIALPELKLSLLEATAKKTEFLKYVVSTLGLQDTEVITGRAEDMARMERHREQYDIVTARAVSQLASLAELTLPFCRIGGLCILPKKGDTSGEIEEAANAINILGGQLREIKRLELEELDDDRHLVVIEKTAPVPDKYPRRPGMPDKRPIK